MSSTCKFKLSVSEIVLAHLSIQALVSNPSFSFPAILYVAPVPLLVLAAAYSLYRGLTERRDYQPFLSALSLFIICFIGLGISFYPHIAPPSITIWDAAAPKESLAFLLVGAAILVPMILAYTAHSYWVFRGKVREGEGYH